ncbi:MAG TPA: hypothetical protein VIR33_00260 [Thermopolyspora sp.]
MIRTTPPLLATLLTALTGCAAGVAAPASEPPAWQNIQINAVSTTKIGAGVAATTSMRPDGTLQTVALDLTSGRKLWAHPATMVGRLPGMGVQPPAVVPDQGAADRGLVAALEPPRQKGSSVALVGRDARTGRQRWSRPMRSTFGPQRCDGYLCVSENTSLATAQVVVLDPATGRQMWKLPGIAEVEWSGAGKVVLLRLADHPVLEAHDLKTGRTIWRQPVERALGAGVDLSGGWAFGATSTDLIGYIAPYSDGKTGTTSAFGMFSVRLGDGTVNWMRPSVVRVYPSGSPGVAPVVRPVDKEGQYGGFALLDAASGRVVGQITSGQVPGTGWWLAFPGKPTTLGFLKRGRAGAVFDLTTGQAAPVKGERGWSFCRTDPKPLKLPHISPPGFYSVASLCEFDLANGERIADAGVPPVWFTGSQNGWRLWRDDRGGLHAVKDGTATTPSMYGA